MRQETGLRVDGLSYWWGPRQALDRVGFAVEPGRFCALLGPNRAGKSTLFGLLCRLYRAREGRIAIAGHDLAQAPLPALAALGIVFQQPTLDPTLTVLQNLFYAAALHGLTGRAARIRAEETLERLGMAERSHEKAGILNGGHRRRLEIARALLHRPQVLLLDEPTVGLDPDARAAITDHAHALAAQGIAVLWATHLTDEIRPDDQLLVLHRGKLLADGRMGEVTAGRPLQDVFLDMTQEREDRT
jgi:ABC-2 type transport system ATP-binding protein